ncbi:MAG TPA: nucleoside-diphosphate sugar epimerase/dehydratase [Clostridiaceae bacterium]
MVRLKSVRELVLIVIDIAFVNIAFLMAFYFRFNFTVPNFEITFYKSNAIIITAIYIVILYLFKLYKSLWIYASIDEFMFAIGGCVSATIASIGYFAFTNKAYSLSIVILAGIFSTAFIVGFRMSFRIMRRYLALLDRKQHIDSKRIMIIGAGQAGTTVIKEMKMNTELDYNPVVLIDDDRNKQGSYIAGIKVAGNRNSIEEIARKYEIHEVIIAIASLNNKNKKELLDICMKTGCKVKVIPSISEIIDGKVTLNKIRDVHIEDLLSRDPVELNLYGIRENIKDKIVMVTGGGGSIGSELCRQIIKFKPKQLLVLENYENNAYDLQQEFKREGVKVEVIFIMASVRDIKRLDFIFNKFRPDMVFHAAAHKHVPLMEDNPAEAVKNNILGTLNLVQTADKYGVKRFVMISTDKAVNPTNVMGATKRVCEMIVQAMSVLSKTQFVAVRFGNVLGSNGSVVPLFIKQIQNGGPVTVTHKEINRFFMTIPEAAQLVLQASTFAKGGEIFVLDMESPVKIYDLACNLIRLSGLIPNEDIKIEITGLRPGEKLYEELLTDEEGLINTSNNKIFVGKSTFIDFHELKGKIDELRLIVEKENEEDNKEDIIRKLQELVPTYKRFKALKAAVNS